MMKCAQAASLNYSACLFLNATAGHLNSRPFEL